VASEVLLDVDDTAREAAAIEPALVLDGDMPRLIDEWQLAPGLWNHVRRRVDKQDGDRFVLTGSAVPADDATRHTGAGRFARLRMRPMSLYESGRSVGELSLRGLLSGEGGSASAGDLAVRDLVDEICIGGWPGLRRLDVAAAQRSVADYVEAVCRTDISRVDGVERDPERVRRLMRSVARNVGTRAPLTTLAKDTAGGGPAISDDTVRGYLDALTRLMVVEDLPAWTGHLRSRADLRTTPVRHFTDPSIAAAAIRAGPEKLLADLNYTGLLFESLVIRDLRVYAQAFDGQVRQYRDNKGVEVDAIVETGEGRWGAFEVKLGDARIDEGAASVKRFAAKVDTAKAGEPAVLGVITGSGYGYRRRDGVQVIPISTLGP
jgi:predicted AAA+ superfamily ATPase